MAAENNPFYVRPPNVYDALMTGVGGYNEARQIQQQSDIKQARADAAKLLSSGDQQGAMARLIQYDPQGAALLSHIYQQSPAGITATETARQEVAQKYAPKTSNIKLPDGTEVTATHEPGGGYSLPNVQGVPATPPNSFAAPGKQTDTETAASGYARRMFTAEGIIRPLEKVGTSTYESSLKGLGEHLPMGIGKPIASYLSSEDSKKLDQAKSNFISGVLRRESGKLISPKEYADADVQYFPQPNDSQAVIDQKRQARADAIREVAGAAGRTFKSPFTFGANNEMIPAGTQTAAPGAPGATTPNAPATPPASNPSWASRQIANARAVIAANPSIKAGVIKKLVDAGVDPSGL